MKRTVLFGLTALVASSLLGADSTSKDDITNAVKKLGEKANYSWRTTIVVPEDAPFKPGPTDGKTEKDGLTWVSMGLMDRKMEALVKGEKGAAANQEGVWKSLEELDKEEGRSQFLAMIVRNVKTPTKEATELAAFAKELTKEGDVYSGDLTEEGAKTLQMFGRRGGSGGPTVSDAKGSVKFWLKEGALTKYEFKLKGKVSWNGREFPNDRTTTVEIKDVGTTKLEVPEEGRKKISG